MFRQLLPVGIVVLALAGPAALPANAEQGKDRGHTQHVVKSKQTHKVKHAQGKQKPKVKNKVKDNRGVSRRADDPWTDKDRARYGPWLPPGMTLEQAAAGFDNRGQFIAALNASREHNVSFVQLKHVIVDQRMSLGEALRRLRR